MEMPEKIDTIMFAPCGMNCKLCIKHLDDIPSESANLAEKLGNKNKAEGFIEKWNLEISKLSINETIHK